MWCDIESNDGSNTAKISLISDDLKDRKEALVKVVEVGPVVVVAEAVAAVEVRAKDLEVEYSN